MKRIIDILLALVSGTIIGAIFTLIRLPIPSPNAWAGIAGIAGILLGSLLVKYFIK